MGLIVDDPPILLIRLGSKLLTPSLMRLLAPVLGVVVVVIGRWAWRRSGRSALGRAWRWWCVAMPSALLLSGCVYLLVAPPEDPDLATAMRLASTDRLGRAAFPAPLAAVGALAVAGTAVAAGWSWRYARLSRSERLQLATEWSLLRRRGMRLGRIALAASLLLLATTWLAGASGAPQVPPPPPPPPPPAAAAAAPEPGSGGSRGTLWVGTASGVSRLLPAPGRQGMMWEALIRPRAPLAATRVTGIVAGPQGDVWLATLSGLAHYTTQDTSSGWKVLTAGNSSLPHRQVWGLAVDSTGTAWAATARGAAAVTARGEGRSFTNLNAPLLHQALDAAYVDAQGRVWLAGARGVNVYQPRTPAPVRQPIGGEQADEDQGEEEGEWRAGFGKNSTNDALPDYVVYTLYGDSQGRVWFGTPRGAAVLTPLADVYGLGAFEPARWQTFTRANSPLFGDVHAIVEDRQGRIWFGTADGIHVLDQRIPEGAEGRWHRFTAAAGASNARSGADTLPHPRVQALALGPDGRIWAGTRGGLAVYDPAQPAAGWLTYSAHPLRRWTGYLWPAHWQQNILSNDVSALAWVR